MLPGLWNASQDLQRARINISTLGADGLRIQTSSFIAAGSNALITSLAVNKPATLSFALLFAQGSEGHATRAGVHGGTGNRRQCHPPNCGFRGGGDCCRILPLVVSGGFE